MQKSRSRELGVKRRRETTTIWEEETRGPKMRKYGARGHQRSGREGIIRELTPKTNHVRGSYHLNKQKSESWYPASSLPYDTMKMTPIGKYIR